MHYRINILNSALILVLLFSFSCKREPLDLTPSYISIDSIGLTNTSFQGTNSHSITDAWVYINDQVQGVYELPAKFPVLAEGMQKITIRPGIKINGIASTRMFYPFFEPIEYNINLVKDSTVQLSPVTSYHPSVNFAWLEDFEDGGISIERTNKSQVDISKTSNPQEVFEGNYSAKIVLDSNRIMFECYTISAYILNGNAINFLELNYKNNYDLHVGVFAYLSGETVQRSVLVLNKTDVWKKIYINLTNAVTENITATNFKVFFGILKADGDTEIPTVYLDNIKLIHY